MARINSCMSNEQAIKFAALKHRLAAGVRDPNEGRFQTDSDLSLMKLADGIGRSGKIRLNGLRVKVATTLDEAKDLKG
jgi:hypothetical protein